MGAEAYVMQNVKDLATARALLGKIARFKDRLAWHGVTPEEQSLGRQQTRGLYNIALKSLGAVHKKRSAHADRCGDRLRRADGRARILFHEQPGNDLEGIAGQVGAGCNLFLFVTGNGSVTNFPFVPTLKLRRRRNAISS